MWIVAVALTACLHNVLPAPRWLLVHVLFLGAVSHAVFVWSQYFADSLLHAARAGRSEALRIVRLCVVNLFAVIILGSVALQHVPLIVVGAAGLVVMLAWHATVIVSQLVRSPSSRFAITICYYVAAAWFFFIGISLGTIASFSWSPRLVLGHILANVFGWIGLTVLGTILTLWPTMLRTKIVPDAEYAARQSIWIACLALLAAIAGALANLQVLTAIGLTGYGCALLRLAVPFVRTARQKPPAHFATWSVMAALAWYVITTLTLAVTASVQSSWSSLEHALRYLTPALAIGFAAQVLIGALSYLIPVIAARGPSSTRAANLVLNQGFAFRVSIINFGLIVFLLPVPNPVKTSVLALIILTVSLIIPAVFFALYTARRTYTSTHGSTRRPRHDTVTAPAKHTTVKHTVQVALGIGCVLLAATIGIGT